MVCGEVIKQVVRSFFVVSSTLEIITEGEIVLPTECEDCYKALKEVRYAAAG